MTIKKIKNGNVGVVVVVMVGCPDARLRFKSLYKGTWVGLGW